MRFRTMAALAGLSAVALGGCASLGALGQIIQPPQFSEERERPAELILGGLGGSGRLGTAGVRIYARVYNPNSFGLTLSTLDGDLYLDDRHAAKVDFPLGLPLTAGGEDVVPIELTVGLDNLPGLAGTIGRAVFGSRVGYRLDGRVGVDAGPFGRPTLGPMRILDGDLTIRR